MRLLKFLMFNRFVRLYLDSDFWFLRLNRRVKCLILEMWYTLTVLLPFLLATMVLTRTFGNPIPFNRDWTDLVSEGSFALLMIALFNKDFFGAQSVVHRKLGYKVLDSKTNETASKVQCLLRNMTGPIWPIEVIFILVNPKRRMGDIIAGTILSEVPISDPELILTDIKASTFDKQTKLAILISVVFVLTLSVLFDPRIKFW